MIRPRHITIPAQFNGPAESGNGGYCAGALAVAMQAPIARVSLRSPPPLDTKLTLKEEEDGRLAAYDRGTLIMEAREANLTRSAPAAPSLAAAETGHRHYLNPADHMLPTCFVCGPDRHAGDGLRLFTGEVDGFSGVADVWVPHPNFADDDGAVRPEIVWAALDCPSAFAIPDDTPKLLASITARIDHRPKAGDKLIVVGWHKESDGRKHQAGTALYSAQGELLAESDTLWIGLRGPQVI